MVSRCLSIGRIAVFFSDSSLGLATVELRYSSRTALPPRYVIQDLFHVKEPGLIWGRSSSDGVPVSTTRVGDLEREMKGEAIKQ